MSTTITAKAYHIAGTSMICFGLVLVFVFGLPWFVGLGPFAVGLGVLVTPTVIDGVPRLVRAIWNSAEPAWDGEILHTDSGDAKIRYGFDKQGSPWFVAKDVCAAIGEKAPGNRAINWAGVQLIRCNDLCCFSEEAVKLYLTPLSAGNHDARRLLVILQGQIFRRIEKEREQKKLFG